MLHLKKSSIILQTQNEKSVLLLRFIYMQIKIIKRIVDFAKLINKKNINKKGIS